MIDAYSPQRLQTNQVEYQTKMLESPPAPSEPKTELSFSQQLSKALLAEEAASPQRLANEQENSEVGLASISPVDVGLGLLTGNPMAGFNFIGELMSQQDIEQQFGELGKGIAAALLASLAGDPRATELAASGESTAASDDENATTKVRSESIPTVGSVPKAMQEVNVN